MADFALGSNHKLVHNVTRFALVTGVHATAQRLKIALLHFKGEWFRDESAGTDYRGAIVGKNTDLARRAEIRRRCLSVPGIRSVQSMTFKLDSKTRKLSVRIFAVADSGDVIDVSLDTGG
jgi:hypothetical protein